MSVLSGILKTFVGDKAKKDLKGLYPLVDKIHQAAQGLTSLSHDELRAKTTEFKQRIADIRKPLFDEIEEIKTKIDALTDLDEKELRYADIDRITTQAHEEVAAYLDDILPEAFAVVKETAKRFKDNEEIEVTATPFDRLLSATKANVKIKSEKALWQMHGMPQENRLLGTWCTTTCNWLAVSSYTKVKLLKCKLVKEKHWWLPYPFI